MYRIVVSAPVLVVDSHDRKVKALSRLRKIDRHVIEENDFAAHIVDSELRDKLVESELVLRLDESGKVWLDVCYFSKIELNETAVERLREYTWEQLLDGVTGFKVQSYFVAANALGSVCDVRSEQTQAKPRDISIDKSLLNAAKRGSLAGVKKALSQGGSLDAVDKQGRTALHLALKEDTDTARYLLEVGANVNAVDERGTSPLLACIDAYMPIDMELIDELLRRGAHSHHADVNGYTALLAAARIGNMALVEKLLLLGGEVNYRDKLGGSAATWTLSPDVLHCLLKSGYDAQAVDKDGLNLRQYLRAKLEEEIASPLGVTAEDAYRDLITVYDEFMESDV